MDRYYFAAIRSAPSKRMVSPFKYLFSNTISNGINFVSRWLVNYGLARFMSLSDFWIFSFISSLANLFKRRCGVGLDISNLRPENAPVNNSAGTTTGAWSFADFYSYV